MSVYYAFDILLTVWNHKYNVKTNMFDIIGSTQEPINMYSSCPTLSKPLNMTLTIIESVRTNDKITRLKQKSTEFSD